jgi:hypothetical protein
MLLSSGARYNFAREFMLSTQAHQLRRPLQNLRRFARINHPNQGSLTRITTEAPIPVMTTIKQLRLFTSPRKLWKYGERREFNGGAFDSR